MKREKGERGEREGEQRGQGRGEGRRGRKVEKERKEGGEGKEEEKNKEEERRRKELRYLPKFMTSNIFSALSSDVVHNKRPSGLTDMSKILPDNIKQRYLTHS